MSRARNSSRRKRALQAHSVSPEDLPALAGLPRPRPESLPPKRAIQAIHDLRRAQPPIFLTPKYERTFLEGIVLTQEKCLLWLAILKQFFPVVLSDPMPLRTSPPISFLNLLTDWIDVYAKVEGRRKIKEPQWRWKALCGFINRKRPLQSRKLLKNISRLANSIATHFDDPLFLLWGDYFQPPSSCTKAITTEESEAAKIFDVLKRVVVNKGRVLDEDYRRLKRYVSKEFREPSFARFLPDDRERKELAEFVARAAAMDVYLQYRRMGDETDFDQHYVKDATGWLLKLGEPEARLKIEVIHWRFCARPTVNLGQRPKKSVLRSKAT